MAKPKSRNEKTSSKRTLIVTVFVTKEEKTRLGQAADREGLGLSTYMRACALRSAGDDP